jgi:hypothetical protein
MATCAVEVFSAGCAAYTEVIDLVQQAACPSCDVIILDMHDPAVARRAWRVYRALGRHPACRAIAG